MQRVPSIEPCAPRALPALVAEATRIFRGPEAPPTAMGEAYPLLFNEANCGNLWVALQGHNLLGHVGYVPRTLRTQRGTRRVATFGAVFVRETERGHGLASALLLTALSAARKAGADLALVSGSGPLYHRQGFVPLPPNPVHRIANATAGAAPALTMSRATEAQWPVLNALYAARSPPRLDRNPQQWQAILRSRTVHHRTGSIVLLGAHDVGMQGYFAVEDEPRERAGQLSRRVLEWGGNPQCVHRALQAQVTSEVAIDWVLAPNEEASLPWLPADRRRTSDLGFCALSLLGATLARDLAELPAYGLDYV